MLLRCRVKAKDQLAFRLELARLLLRFATRCKVQSSSCRGEAQGVSVCYLKKVSAIGLKRGRCHQCLKMKRKGHTSFGCSVCRVRLCKTRCFEEYHNYWLTYVYYNVYNYVYIHVHAWMIMYAMTLTVFVYVCNYFVYHTIIWIHSCITQCNMMTIFYNIHMSPKLTLSVTNRCNFTTTLNGPYIDK